MIKLKHLLIEGKEQIKYIAYMENRGSINTYFGVDVIETKHGYQGTIYQYMFLHKYPNKQKGWVKFKYTDGKHFGSPGDDRIMWNSGTIKLDIKKEIN